MRKPPPSNGEPPWRAAFPGAKRSACHESRGSKTCFLNSSAGFSPSKRDFKKSEKEKRKAPRKLDTMNSIPSDPRSSALRRNETAAAAAAVASSVFRSMPFECNICCTEIWPACLRSTLSDDGDENAASTCILLRDVKSIKRTHHLICRVWSSSYTQFLGFWVWYNSKTSSKWTKLHKQGEGDVRARHQIWTVGHYLSGTNLLGSHWTSVVWDIAVTVYTSWTLWDRESKHVKAKPKRRSSNIMNHVRDSGRKNARSAQQSHTQRLVRADWFQQMCIWDTGS